MKTREELERLKQANFTPPKKVDSFLKVAAGISGLSSIGHIVWLLTTDFEDMYGSDASEVRSNIVATLLSCGAAFFGSVYFIIARKSRRETQRDLAKSYLRRDESICQSPYALTCRSQEQQGEELFVCWCYSLDDAMTARKLIREAYSEEDKDCIEGTQIYDETGKKCLRDW